MKRCGLVLGLGVALMFTAGTDSHPVKEAHRTKGRVEADAKGVIVREWFKGGERACVIVEGDHEPIVDLALEVTDSKGQVVAKYDRGGDLAAVIWYPPEDGEYTVTVHNQSGEYNVKSGYERGSPNILAIVVK